MSNALASITDANEQNLRRSLTLETKLDVTPAGIGKGVACEFGDRGGEPGLILGIEA
jgi:hypothetical protein